MGLTGLLSDILDNEAAIEKALNEILLKWKNCEKLSESVVEPDADKLDITEKMHQITQEKLANFTISKVEKTEEEKRLKEAILHGYAEGGSGSSDEDEEGGPVDLGPANTNAADVQKECLERRENKKKQLLQRNKKIRMIELI